MAPRSADASARPRVWSWPWGAVRASRAPSGALGRARQLALFGLALLPQRRRRLAVRRALLTWPSYNNAIRLAAVAVLPAALAGGGRGACPGLRSSGDRPACCDLRPCRSRAVVACDSCCRSLVSAERRLRRPGRAVVASVLPPRRRAVMGQSATSCEPCTSSRAYVPLGGVVAADPWKGGTYMYVVGDRRMYSGRRRRRTRHPDTASDRTTPRRGRHRPGGVPPSCTDAGITHALTGGVPFLWGGAFAHLVGTKVCHRGIAGGHPDLTP